MAETFDKNMIDKDEYPATAAIEQRCVCMVADLFHAEDLRDDDPASADRGVDDRVQRGGDAGRAGAEVALARTRRAKDAWKGRTPNLVMGSNVQVVWEKFCRYFDVEPRYLPMEKGRYVITPEQVLDDVDEDTIGVVGDPGHHVHRRTRTDRRDLRGAGQAGRRRRDRTSRCTSTRPAAASSCRSCTPTWCGTSGCRGWCRSTSAATSTA